MNLDTLLHDTSVVADPSPTTLKRARAALHAAQPVTDPAGRRPAGRWPVGRRPVGRHLVLAGIAAAMVAAAVVAPVVSSLGGGAPAARASAATVLRQAAAAAGAQPGGWPDAAYWHSTSRFSRDGGPDQRREIWIGHHAPGVLTEPLGEPGFVALEVGRFPAGGTSLTWDDLYALPTDPTVLEARLQAGIHGTGNGDAAELFVIVGDLLRESPAPPALRRALYEVAARVPGVELVGTVTDHAGRAGVAVRRGSQTYVVDPADGRLLEEVEEADDVSWRATYLQQGPADAAPAATIEEPKKSAGTG